MVRLTTTIVVLVLALCCAALLTDAQNFGAMRSKPKNKRETESPTTEATTKETEVTVEEQQDEEPITDEPDDTDKYVNDYCADAPSKWHKRMCEQLYRWDKNAREAPPVTDHVVMPPAIPGMPTMFAADLAAVPMNSYQCMDLGCLCQYIGGDGKPNSNECKLKPKPGQNYGEPLRKAVRKEYRQLTDEERGKYHAALKAVKASKEYDRLAIIHKNVDGSGAAHSGPAFLPWHREYLKRYEIVLRQIDPTVALPYWDSSLEGHLPTPADSILFTENFAGENNKKGEIVSGDFVNWRTFDGTRNLKRFVGEMGTLPTDEGVESFINHDKTEIMFGYSAPQRGCPFFEVRYNVIEYFHGGPHIFVGGEEGDMGDIPTAGNDPLFWMHHNFIDYIYEMWRKRSPAKARETNYPLDNAQCASPQHFSAGPMHPFQPWQNIDGLVNKYTDNMYEFAPRPSCSMGPDCGSKYLFCDRSHGKPRCAAKVRPNGNCAGFTNGEDVCMNGECQYGKCVKKSPPPTTPKPPPIVTVAPIESPCFNEHECCAKWAADGQCESNSEYMSQFCKASCKKCQYSYNMQEECADRHKNCKDLSYQMKCDSSWMAENCRKYCNKCNVKRMQTCAGGSPGGEKPTLSYGGNNGGCKSNQCYNENICCQHWAMNGGCKKNSEWMNCNCKVSCGQCISRNYKYGTCSDYHPKCFKWAKHGQCKSNGWVLANCRRSCNSCASIWHIKKMCADGRGKRSVGDYHLWADAMEDTPISLLRMAREAEMEQKEEKKEEKAEEKNEEKKEAKPEEGKKEEKKEETKEEGQTEENKEQKTEEKKEEKTDEKKEEKKEEKPEEGKKEEKKEEKTEEKKVEEQKELKKELNSDAVVMMLNVDAVEKAMEASSTSGMGPIGPPKGHSKSLSAYVVNDEDLPKSSGMPSDA
ncbi:hypothetical protein niasHS_001389 [Heterodera schachtii]|uniref:ShKT domain-containing protein n=1 Tax=Heterodera schachtii TaxID=97005 RepID=A0ABD2KEK6_HETSC